jgi:hypothetical protein
MSTDSSANTVIPEGPSVFQTKYDEFAKELLETFPELSTQIRAAVAIPAADRLSRFQAEVKVSASADINTGAVLPGVVITNEVWASLTPTNQKAVWEYIRLLSMCCFLEGFGSPEKGFMDSVMNDWKSKLEGMDVEGLLKKFGKMFSFGSDVSGNSTDASGASTGFKMPKLPEKFLKGQLAKLAEEIVRDIKPEDLGLTPELMAECEKSPSRAFDLLVHVFTKNPGAIQGIIKRIGKRLQQKVQSGAIRPNEIAKEAEELMKEFAGNTDMVGMMESLKSTFGFEDPDLARAAGRDGSARLSLVKERLRKKLEAKKNKK